MTVEFQWTNFQKLLTYDKHLMFYKRSESFFCCIIMHATVHIYSHIPPNSLYSWLCGTVVERRSLAGEFALSCARPAADG